MPSVRNFRRTQRRSGSRRLAPRRECCRISAKIARLYVSMFREPIQRRRRHASSRKLIIMSGHRRHRVSHASPKTIRSTTILGVRRNGVVAMAGDGQVTVGDVVLKHGARKIRMLYDGAVIAGFAGAVADALTLFSKFESQLKSSDGNLRKASVELAKEWRTDRYLRRLEAQLIVGDGESILSYRVRAM